MESKYKVNGKETIMKLTKKFLGICPINWVTGTYFTNGKIAIQKQYVENLRELVEEKLVTLADLNVSAEQDKLLNSYSDHIYRESYNDITEKPVQLADFSYTAKTVIEKGKRPAISYHTGEDKITVTQYVDRVGFAEVTCSVGIRKAYYNFLKQLLEQNNNLQLIKVQGEKNYNGSKRQYVTGYFKIVDKTTKEFVGAIMGCIVQGYEQKPIRLEKINSDDVVVLGF